MAYLRNTTARIANAVTGPGATIDGAVTVGVDGTGHDVKFFGATASRHAEWDESADQLNIHGKVVNRFGSAFHNTFHAAWALE